MSELIDREAVLDSVYKNLPMIPSMAGMTAEEMRLRIAVMIENAPAASPWHRVEEPPEEEGRYWFAVWFDGHWIFDAAWYTHDISKVIDVPCCERVGGFYKGNTEVHPDYWMPIEPPKEDA